MTDAPSCPISYGQPIPGARVFLKGTPWRRPRDVQDQIDSIPRATDLRSAIFALNRMKSLVSLLTRGEPVVNNTRIPKEPDVTLKGEDHNPNYGKLDWVEEIREFETQKIHNPDDEEQYIEVKVLKTVRFFNPNTDYRLTYYSKVA
jgi:hypothetical protein